jgi:hypothetical protein
MRLRLQPAPPASTARGCRFRAVAGSDARSGGARRRAGQRLRGPHDRVARARLGHRLVHEADLADLPHHERFHPGFPPVAGQLRSCHQACHQDRVAGATWTCSLPGALNHRRASPRTGILPPPVRVGPVRAAIAGPPPPFGRAECRPSRLARPGQCRPCDRRSAALMLQGADTRPMTARLRVALPAFRSGAEGRPRDRTAPAMAARTVSPGRA